MLENMAGRAEYFQIRLFGGHSVAHSMPGVVKLVEIIPLKNCKIPICLGKGDVDQFFGNDVAR